MTSGFSHVPWQHSTPRKSRRGPLLGTPSWRGWLTLVTPSAPVYTARHAPADQDAGLRGRKPRLSYFCTQSLNEGTGPAVHRLPAPDTLSPTSGRPAAGGTHSERPWAGRLAQDTAHDGHIYAWCLCRLGPHLWPADIARHRGRRQWSTRWWLRHPQRWTNGRHCADSEPSEPDGPQSKPRPVTCYRPRSKPRPVTCYRPQYKPCPVTCYRP